MGVYRDSNRGTWVADVQKGEKRVRLKDGSMGTNPNAIRKRKTFNTKKEAEEWYKKEAARVGKKPKRNYSHKSFNGIIDSAVEDGRMTPERAKELKSISGVNAKRQAIKNYITILDDGNIEYKPLKDTSPWRSSPYLRRLTRKDKANINWRVKDKLTKAKSSDTKIYEELNNRLNLLKDVNSAEDLANWESDFNTSYDELLGNKPIYITDPDQIDRIVKQRVNETIRKDKQRTTRYKIDDGSWVTYRQLRDLIKEGANPNILQEIIPGYFDEADEKKIRADYTRQLTDYLKGGGDLRTIPHFGHKIAVYGTDDSKKQVVSGLTTASNVGAQDPNMNLKLGSKVAPEMLSGEVPEKVWRGRGFLPGLLGMATLPLWLMAPDRAQAMVDTGQQNISSAANKYLPQGLMDYAKRIGSTVDNYIGQSFPTNTLGGIQANIGQYLFDSLKQVPAETVGVGMALKDIHDKSKNAPERNLSWAERMRLMQSGRSY